MAKISTKITKLPKVVGRFDTDFIETADKFLNQLPNTYTELNSFANEVNGVRNEVNNLRNATKSYRDEAYNKAEEAKAVVIPEEATYSKDEIELRSLTVGEAQFEALKEERRKQYAASGFVNHSTSINTFGSINGIEELINGKLNINGNFLNTEYLPSIKLPQSPTAFAVTDSLFLPQAMKQGDFAVLADLDRELITNGTFDSNINNWSGHFTNDEISWDSNNDAIHIERKDSSHNYFGPKQYKSLIKNTKYILKFDVVNIGNGVSYIKDALGSSNGAISNGNLKITSTGSFEIEFVSNISGNVAIEIQGMTSSSDLDSSQNFTLDNISVKQAEETPIVALQDVGSNIDVYENIDKFEVRDSILRQDLVFLESWEEKISDKDIVYPYGNIQYRGSDVDGLTGIADGDFTGADIYSLFGNWQAASDLVGKGYKWSALTLAEKKALVSNPENNIYVDENGEFIQVRYKINVLKGRGNNWNIEYFKNYGLISSITNNGHSIILDNNSNYIPIALVQRRNQAIYHPVYNPEGTAITAYDDGDGLQMKKWYELPSDKITSLQDCIDPDNIAIYKTDSDGNISVNTLSNQDGTYMVTGLIESSVSGRPDGIYADEVNERDVEDLRMSAHKKVFKEMLDEQLNKAIIGDIRGKENYCISKKFTKNLGRAYDDYTSLINWGLKPYNLTWPEFKEKISNGGSFMVVTPSNNQKTLWIKYYSDYIYNGNLRGLYIRFYESPESTNSLPIHSGIDNWSPNPKLNGCYMIVPTGKKSYTYNNTLTQTDIIGDPRSLQDRINLTIDSSNNDSSGNITTNMYVYTVDSGANNNSKAGHLYRSLKAMLSIEYDGTDSSKNVDNGAIDFSDDAIWVDLGTDLTVGGYPQEWLDRGFAGTPLIVGKEGQSLLPVDKAFTSCCGADCSAWAKLNKKFLSIKEVLVSDINGNFVKINSNPNYCDSSNVYYYYNNTENVIAIGFNGYSNIGYASAQEMLDLMKVIVTYETKANNMELANNSEGVEFNDEIVALNSRWVNEGNTIISALINKVGVSSSARRIERKNVIDKGLTGFNMIFGYAGNEVVHNALTSLMLNNPAVKIFTYLTQSNNRVYLQFVFKELKYDSGASSWGDDNKFQIVNKVSTVIDTNGQTVLIGQKRIPLNFFIPNED